MKKFAIAALVLTLIGTLSVSAFAEEYVIEKDPMYNVSTQELLERFPIAYETPAETDMAKKIQNRMLNGFNTWNLGYDAWEHWGEVLYSPESIYNVHGAHLTLPEYQMAMNVSLKATDIQMGQFQNMILSGDWAAIRYDTSMTNRETGETTFSPVTEFVRFKDFGDRGAKVDEGWGGVKDASFSGTSYFMTEEERNAQQAMYEELLALTLADEDDLEAKYPVTYPTPIDTEMGMKIKAAILQDFENWNSGSDAWTAWADSYYTEDAAYHYGTKLLDLDGAKAEAARQLDELSAQRVRIDNILISEDWAGVHYWNIITAEDGTRTPMDTMAFLHFVPDGDSVKIDMCWIHQGF